MDLSIIIVSYNTKDLLLQTLDSVYESKNDLRTEVFVVDNASTDGSAQAVAELFPQVKLVQSVVNLGFSGGNNLAIRQATGRYVLLLNSDTIVRPDTFEKMVAFFDAHPKAGAAGCQVVKPDGTLDLACKRGFPTPLNSLYQALKLDKLFPNNPHFSSYNLTYLDDDGTYPIDCLVGAFMLVRREAVEQVGLLDDQFFMYGEDVDWCYRIKQAGWEIWYHGAAIITHYKGASSQKKKMRMLYEFHRSMVLYYKKHQAANSLFLLNWLVYVGIGCRFAMVVARNLFKKRGKVHDSVLPSVAQSHTHSV